MLTLKTSKQTVTRFAFSADGRYLAAAGTGKKVHFWDLTAKKRKAQLLPTFKDSTEWIGFLSAPGGEAPPSNLFAISLMGQYAIHDLTTNATTELALNRWWVGNIVATADRSFFYGTGWKVRKWRFDGKLHEVWSHDVTESYSISGRGGAVLTPDGELIAAVSNSSNRTWLHTRSAETGEMRETVHAANSLIRDLTLLPDGRTLVFVREQEYLGRTPNALVAGTIGTKFEVIDKPPNDSGYSSLAVHPSGKWIAGGQVDGTVRLFDITTWREVSAYQWPVAPVGGLAFAPNGLTAVAGGSEGKIVMWDVDI